MVEISRWPKGEAAVVKLNFISLIVSPSPSLNITLFGKYLFFYLKKIKPCCVDF